jgi:hypothetical protein
VWWLGGSHGFGHVALSDGGGYVWSTDVLRPGKVDRVTAASITHNWGLSYVGWSEDINGERVYVPPVNPSNPDGGPWGPWPYPTSHLLGPDRYPNGRASWHDGRASRYEASLVRAVQRETGARVDGVYGPETVTKVRAWQTHARATGSTSVRVTGFVDPATWAAMTRR